MVVTGPWLFGTTQAWSIRLFNWAGVALGSLLLVKLVIRNSRGYHPPRWGEKPGALILVLAVLSVLLPVYCLLHAVNARASFDQRTLSFAYHDCIRWLPHSFDREASWSAFGMYSGLGCFFWAVRDWLLGKSSREERAAWVGQSTGMRRHMPDRLRRLLWVVAINGSLLAAEGLVQRMAGSPKLLFLVQPRIHRTAAEQFGPYAYRSNAAEYLNLAWPACVGLWWMLERRRGQSGSRTARVLLPAAAGLMAAGAILSSSRAGAIVAAGLMVVTGLWSLRTGLSWSRGLGWFFGLALVLGLGLGWEALGPRMAELNDGLALREEMYQAARAMAEDFPVFGTGPGSFEMVSYLYPRPDRYWPPQLHNDWLETRITFGWVGSGLIAMAFGTLVFQQILKGRAGTASGTRQNLGAMLWLGLAGCLAHARFDFPLQVHSVLLLFLVWCAVLSCLGELDPKLNHR